MDKQYPESVPRLKSTTKGKKTKLSKRSPERQKSSAATVAKNKATGQRLAAVSQAKLPRETSNARLYPGG